MRMCMSEGVSVYVCVYEGVCECMSVSVTVHVSMKV